MSRRRPAIVLACLLGIAAPLGPRPRVDPPREADVAARVRAMPERLDDVLAASEEVVHPRPDTEKRIVWSSGSPNKTPLAFVYLHGFSASRREISPVVERAAAALGANLFFTRLAGHGLSGKELARPSARDWLEDALEALAIGRRIGERVVVVGTSTGGTLAAWLATRDDAPDAVVLVSPNFGPRATGAGLLTWPWLSIVLPAALPAYGFTPHNEAQAKLWTTRYPVAALVPMMALVEQVRASSLERVRTPLLFVYSSSDAVVDARETDAVYARVPEGHKERERVEIPAGEDAHVIAGDVLGPKRTSLVVERVVDFVRRRVAPP